MNYSRFFGVSVWRVLLVSLCLNGLLSAAYSDQRGDLLDEADKAFLRAQSIWGNGTSADAEALLKRALEIRQAQLGPTDPKIAQVLQRLGALGFNRAQYTDAEKNFGKALDIYIAAFGESSLPAAFLMGDVGATLREEHRYAEAEAIVQRSLALRRRLLLPNELAIASSLNNLGRIYLGERRFSDAEKAFEEAIQVRSSTLPPNHRDNLQDKALLQRARDMEEAERRLWVRAGVAGAISLLSLAVLVSCSLWSERRHIVEATRRPLAVKALGLAAVVGLIGSAGFFGAVITDEIALILFPSVIDSSSNLQQLGKLGGVLAIWLSILLLQVLTNTGRRVVDLPTHPFRLFGLPVAQSKADDQVLLEAGPLFEDAGGSPQWFSAMEYYALVLNRTYKVYVTQHMLCGAKVRGVMSNSVRSPTLSDPRVWVSTRTAELYENLDVESARFLQINNANFHISWKEIDRVEYLPGKKWGMGGLPHSGRLLIHLKGGKSRELVLLGRQNGEALRRKLEELAMDSPS